MKKILKTDFIDHKDGQKSYKAGEDVSHLDDEAIAFLTAGGHIEAEQAKEEKKAPAKKSK